MGLPSSVPGALGAKFKLKSNSKSSASSPDEEELLLLLLEEDDDEDEEEEDVETDLEDAGETEAACKALCLVMFLML